MRLTCPICGARDRREFYCAGAHVRRPAEDAPIEDWDAYVHLRDNPAGVTRDLWCHEAGCGAWLVVTRDTRTHEVHDVVLAQDVALEAGS